MTPLCNEVAGFMKTNSNRITSIQKRISVYVVHKIVIACKDQLCTGIFRRLIVHVSCCYQYIVAHLFAYICTLLHWCTCPLTVPATLFTCPPSSSAHLPLLPILQPVNPTHLPHHLPPSSAPNNLPQITCLNTWSPSLAPITCPSSPAQAIFIIIFITIIICILTCTQVPRRSRSTRAWGRGCPETGSAGRMAAMRSGLPLPPLERCSSLRRFKHKMSESAEV